jgi:hypothetical protein
MSGRDRAVFWISMAAERRFKAAARSEDRENEGMRRERPNWL